MSSAIVSMLAGCELDNDSTNSATIYPESASLKAEVTNIIEFIADGGNNNYKWSMNNDLLGTLFIATSNTAFALYQNATNTGANIISVRDSGGKSANARIVQK